MLTVALAIDEKFRSGIAGINKDGSILSFPARPCPVRKDVQGICGLVPDAAVQIIAVFGQACQVNDAEYGTVAGPGIRVVRRGFAQIVETRPDKLPDSPVVIIGQGKVLIGHIRPRAILHIIPRRLVVGIRCPCPFLYREFIDSAGTYGRGGFRTKNDILRKCVVRLHIAVGAVVETGNVYHSGETVFQDARHLVHTAGNRTCGVFAVAYILQERSNFIALGTALRRYFVANAPHDHTRIITVMAQHIHHVPLRPFVEVTVIAIIAFGNIPFIERLYHHHKAHFVAKFHQFRSRHVVRCTDGIAAHILQQRELAAESSHIDGSPQRSQVVMVADALKLTVLTVQEKTFVRHNLYAADAETGGIFVHQPAVGIYLGRRLVEPGCLRRP